ncbi:MAG: hypothetical protein LBU17_04995 [Treponema sp.]|jgi:hypothetical protein|nr:hypothetical protein [Treponema sp.]
MRVLIPVWLALVTLAPLVGQDRRGLEVILADAEGKDAVVGRQWAMFIAIDRYQEWRPLSNPVRDTTSIGENAFAQNKLTSVSIGANVSLNDVNGSWPCIPNGFDDYYNSTGKRAETYRYDGKAWSYAAR